MIIWSGICSLNIPKVDPSLVSYIQSHTGKGDFASYQYTWNNNRIIGNQQPSTIPRATRVQAPTYPQSALGRYNNTTKASNINISGARTTKSYITDSLGRYGDSVVNTTLSGANTSASFEATGMVGFGFGYSGGTALDTERKVCNVDSVCFLLGPRFGGSASGNIEVATGTLSPGEKTTGVSLEGAVVPIAGIKGNVTLYGNGSVGYSYSKSLGADTGVALKVCSVETKKDCKDLQ
ncbi:hypothetical protein [Moraxella cuniculi]|uniref:Uncharacterized protein n=1 Tax=Moraxella cuniculi TaxID=34061 RepID=A0A448GX50_9GAMM|nr:hypothetical protein [Moraxella cuniculi]VEG13345.1 Uncharacterised protein [Moraxella cuniculi]